MITIEKLNSFGANTTEGLSRCFNKEDLYLKLVATIPSQEHFDKLVEAVDNGDLKEGFQAAHALKGVLGNLSLSPLYEKVCDITELLRVETDTDYAPLLEEITTLRNELKALCD